MTEKLFYVFPPETPQNIREDVINRFLTHIETLQVIKESVEVSPTRVYHVHDSIMGPLTIDEMIAKCWEMRTKYPKMNGIPSPIIEDLEGMKGNPTIKSLILMDYEYVDKLNWIIITFK